MQKGDFVEIDYVAKMAGKDKVFDTTMEEKAKEYDIYKENYIYEPIHTVVGAGYVVEGMDDALLDINVGEEKTVEVPPEKGYGKRDPKLMVKVPLKEFKKHDVTPRPGLRMEVNGRWATVRNVTSGRVSLDFNHFLAGKTVIYNIKVNEKIEDLDEKIEILIKLNIGTELEYQYTDGTLRVKEGEEIEEKQKENLIDAVKKYIPKIKDVEFVESLEEAEEDNDN